MTLFHALIRTHHITSRKKVGHLRKAASKYDCYALLRSGGCPGIMYCKGDEEGVKEWVGTVQVSLGNNILGKTVKTVADGDIETSLQGLPAGIQACADRVQDRPARGTDGAV